MAKKVKKIRIPAQTILVNVEDYALEYGLEASEVADEIKRRFASIVQEHIDGLGLGPDYN